MRPADAPAPTRPFRVGFVTGATPDRWVRTWRQRSPDPIEPVPVAETEQLAGVRDHSLDLALVRLPVDRAGLHLIPLYDEVPVAVLPREHYLTLAEELTTADLADEQLVLPERSGWTPTAPQLGFPPMSVREAVEVVAAGTGVAVLPMSVARLHHRRDVVHRPVTDLPTSTVGLAWLVERETDRVRRFIGIVRGRTANSSRG